MPIMTSKLPISTDIKSMLNACWCDIKLGAKGSRHKTPIGTVVGLQLWAFPLKMPLSTTFIAIGTLLISLSGPLVVTSVSIARAPAITGQVAYFVALVALRCTWTIMMVVALGTFWQRSTILLFLTRPGSVGPDSVLPLVLLLLVLVVP
ncbi:hypothetical protein Tco_0946996 [Tanacetum coccineum]